jgi:hypothetical protein
MVGVFVTFTYGADFDAARIESVAQHAREMFVGMPGLHSKVFTVDAANRRACRERDQRLSVPGPLPDQGSVTCDVLRSPIDRTPRSCMVRRTSRRRISTARSTPCSPPAMRP